MKYLSALITAFAIASLIGCGESVIPISGVLKTERTENTRPPSFVVAANAHQPTAARDNAPINSPIFTEYYEAMKLGKEQRKPILLCFTAPNCPFSKELISKTLKARDVEKLTANFIIVRISAEQDTDLCAQYKIKGFPTVQLLSANGIPLQRLEGELALSSEHLAIQMHIASHSQSARANSVQK